MAHAPGPPARALCRAGGAPGSTVCRVRTAARRSCPVAPSHPAAGGVECCLLGRAALAPASVLGVPEGVLLQRAKVAQGLAKWPGARVLQLGPPASGLKQPVLGGRPHQGSRHTLQRQMAARQDFFAGLHGRGCPLLAAHNACTVIEAQCRGLVSLLSLRRAEASIPRLQRRHLAWSYQVWFKYEWRALTLKTLVSWACHGIALHDGRTPTTLPPASRPAGRGVRAAAGRSLRARAAAVAAAAE